MVCNHPMVFNHPMVLQSRNKVLPLNKPIVMGVLNLTPDSFSDGGRFFDKHKAVARFEQMIAEGADIIDLGAESTGPGSKEVSQDEESARIIPVIKTVRKLSDIWISIDTYKSEVAEMALKAGADMVNDVLALRGDNRMAEVISKHNVPVVLMYSKDATGRTTGAKKEYKDVIGYINNFFEERIKFAQSSGIKKEQIILDPGQGAFVSGEPKYSFQILKRLKEFSDFKLPILIGPSRKSFIGLTLNLPLHERLEGSLACAAVALMNGAKIIRAHDVKATRRVVDMVHAIISS